MTARASCNSKSDELVENVFDCCMNLDDKPTHKIVSLTFEHTGVEISLFRILGVKQLIHLLNLARQSLDCGFNALRVFPHSYLLCLHGGILHEPIKLSQLLPALRFAVVIDRSD